MCHPQPEIYVRFAAPVAVSLLGFCVGDATPMGIASGVGPSRPILAGPPHSRFGLFRMFTSASRGEGLPSQSEGLGRHSGLPSARPDDEQRDRILPLGE